MRSHCDKEMAPRPFCFQHMAHGIVVRFHGLELSGKACFRTCACDLGHLAGCEPRDRHHLPRLAWVGSAIYSSEPIVIVTQHLIAAG